MEFMSDTDDKRQILSVTEITDAIKGQLEGRFPNVWVEGEISNFKHHGSGHLYFTLKDEGAALAAVCFRFAAAKLDFRPENGKKVQALGAITVYPPRGNYQIKISRMIPAGMGELQLAFERLKKKLEAEGLFAKERKRPLPFMPRIVGVVTSPTGAAIRDVVNVLTRRFPNVTMILCPARVQGPGSKEEIVSAIERLNALEPRPDVLIVGRGGGSLEDLWSFNEEEVARAIVASAAPVVSAVGHETDFSIADFVADRRAPTPSAAAELVVPERSELVERVNKLERRGATAVRRLWKLSSERLVRLQARPCWARPMQRIELLQQRVDDLTNTLALHVRAVFRDGAARFERAAGRLHALSPVATLARGFSIATRADDSAPVRSVQDVERGDHIDVKLSEGRLRCEVLEKRLEDLNGQGKIF